jgi:hypothetical protein
MQKAEAQHGQQNQPAVRQGKGMALDSPQGEQIAQLEAMAERSPQAGKLAQLAAMANGNSRMSAQRKAISAIHNSPNLAAQRRQLDGLAGEAAQRAEAFAQPRAPIQLSVREGDEWDPGPGQGEQAPPTPRPGQGGQERPPPSEGESLIQDGYSPRAGEERDETAQLVRAGEPSQLKVTQCADAHVKPNNTGLPDNLKSGIESLSGMSMDNVKVHYNSSQPAQLNALAYAQGTDIHVAPGQEKHLPHEAWHVVQQAQGRVKPTMQMKDGVPVNDDAGLEREADVMGGRAAALHAPEPMESVSMNYKAAQRVEPSGYFSPGGESAVQLKTEVKWQSQTFKYKGKDDNSIKQKEVGRVMEATLDPSTPIEGGDARTSFQKDMYDSLTHFWNPGAKHWVRGHLLNANLGGPNVAPNLFPITGYANGDHLNYVENHVKKWVIDGNEVRYKIIATQNGGNVTVGDEADVPNAAGSFECYAETTGDEDKKVIHRVINSIPVKRNSPGGDSVAPGHSSSWEREEGRERGEGSTITLNESQLNFLRALIKFNGNTRQAIATVPITLDDWGELNQAIESFEQDAESSLLDNEPDKVGNRVTNAKLKKWLGEKLTDTEAQAWLGEHKKEGTDNEYTVSSS